jgi:hypothetical protein
MARSVLERVLVDKTLEVVHQGAGHCGWATGAGAVSEALDPVGGKAMEPLAQGGIGKVEGVGDGLEARTFDDLAHGLGTTEDTRFLRLFEKGLSGGERLIRKGEFAGPHRGGLQEKVLQKCAMAHSPLIFLLSEQRLFDSNFPGAAFNIQEPFSWISGA